MKGGAVHAIGRRKRAVARIFIKPGSGTITVNDRPYEDYFGREALRRILRQPLVVTDQLEKIDIRANVAGGGLSGQVGAIRHGIARALTKMNPGHRASVKKAGYLTRDAREVERKKYGRHKARKRPQFSKR